MNIDEQKCGRCLIISPCYHHKTASIDDKDVRHINDDYTCEDCVAKDGGWTIRDERGLTNVGYLFNEYRRTKS